MPHNFLVLALVQKQTGHESFHVYEWVTESQRRAVSEIIGWE